MPVFVIALTNPALYIPAIMKTGALGQQAGAVNAASAGRELVGSTLMGAAMALAVWLGLSMWPTLWMLMLWMMAAALWAGRRLFRVKATAVAAVVLGQCPHDDADPARARPSRTPPSARTSSRASATRVALFIAAALYAWATVWALERWRASRVRRASDCPKSPVALRHPAS